MEVWDPSVQLNSHQRALFGNIYKAEIMRMKFGSKMPISEFTVLVEFIYNILHKRYENPLSNKHLLNFVYPFIH